MTEPSSAPPIQLDYQSASVPPAHPDAIILALNPSALPRYRVHFILLKLIQPLLVFPFFYILIMWMTGFLLENPQWAILNGVVIILFLTAIRTVRAWIEITRLWPTFRVIIEGKQVTRTAINRKTIILQLDNLKLAQRDLINTGLVLQDRQRVVLSIPTTLDGFNQLEDRVRTFMPIKPPAFPLAPLLKIAALVLMVTALTLSPWAIWLARTPALIFWGAAAIALSYATVLYIILRNPNLTKLRKFRITLYTLLVFISLACRMIYTSYHL